jgi:hypothetical protein
MVDTRYQPDIAYLISNIFQISYIYSSRGPFSLERYHVDIGKISDIPFQVAT